MTDLSLEARLDEVLRIPKERDRVVPLEGIVADADAAGRRQLAFAARRMLASAYQVSGQWHLAFTVFARSLRDFDAHPNDSRTGELLDWYSFMITSMAEFPDITMDQLREAFADIERRLSGSGYTLRKAHAAHRWVAQLAGDWDDEERYYRKWMAAGGPSWNSVWDFEADVERLVLRGDEKSLARARDIALPVLDGERRFSEPSAPIQCLMLMPLALAGDGERATAAYRAASRLISSGTVPIRYEYSGLLHEFCARTGNLGSGLEDMFCRVPGIYKLNRPNGQMEYAASLSLLCRELTAHGFGDFRFRGPDDTGRVPVAEMARYFRRTALDFAAKFDARNGTAAQGDRIRRRLDASPLPGEPPIAARGPELAPLPPVPPGLTDEQLLARAEELHERSEDNAAWQYLAPIADPPPARLAARVAEVQARLSWNGRPRIRELLQLAERGHAGAGDEVRALICRGWLGRWETEYGDREAGFAMTADAVTRLKKKRARSALSQAMRLHAKGIRAQGQLREAHEMLLSAFHQAGKVDDKLAAGWAVLWTAEWFNSDLEAPGVSTALHAKRFLTEAGAPALVIYALEAARITYGKHGTPEEFSALVEKELAGLPPDADPDLLRYLRSRRGLDRIAAGQAADAVDDLQYAADRARARFNDNGEEGYHLAVALHAARRPADALRELEEALPMLNRRRKRGSLPDPEMADRARDLKADCARMIS